MTISLPLAAFGPVVATRTLARTPQAPAIQTPSTQADVLKSLAEAASSAEAKAALGKLAEQAEAARTLAKSMRQARDEARAQIRNQARQAVERLKEEYKLIRKLWAHDPAEMARQLGRIAKQVKRAVADYAAAAKANGERVKDLPPEPAPAATTAGGERTEARAAARSEDGEQTSSGREDSDGALPAALMLSPRAELAEALKAYARQAPADPFAMTADERDRIRASAEGEAHGDMEFGREIKAFVKKLREELSLAKIRAGAIADKPTAEAFKAAETTLSEIDEAIGKMEEEIEKVFPDLDIPPRFE